MKLNSKFILRYLILLFVPTFLFSCKNGGGSEPGPTPGEYKGLKFTAREDGSTIGYSISGAGLPDIHIQYSRDDGKNWLDWTDGSSSINLNNGESVCVRNTSYTLSKNYPNNPYFHFDINTGEIEASGDVSSMINYGELTDYCFAGMFISCTSLTKAPILPATTLKNCCYSDMFRNCTSLTSTPTLPATELVYYCYDGMFRNCTSLTVAPNLPASTLAERCYIDMFRECTNLELAPSELKATKLDYGCYENMFYGCTKLVSPPTISATELAKYCCENMFNGCEALTSCPYLYGAELKDGCYAYMFKDCTSLKIKDENGDGFGTEFFTCPNIGEGVDWPVKDMFDGTIGAFKDGTPNVGDTYYWYLKDPYKGLKFTATQSNSKIGYTSSDSLTDISIECSIDNGSTWESWDGTDKTLVNVNDTLCVRNTANKLSLSDDEYFTFTMSGEIAASGDVNSMINNEELSEYCYKSLFQDCTALISAPTLPSTTLNNYCYRYMFKGCTNLASTPALPAAILNDGCYQGMFRECSSLTFTPELNADNLAIYCYNGMFYGCSNLISATELPAIVLKNCCYNGMFYNCAKLKINEDAIGTKIFDCPDVSALSDPVTNMFNGTICTFTDGTPTKGKSYYWSVEE